MKLLKLNSDINLSKNSYLVSDIVKSLTHLDAIDFVSFMTSLKLNIPRTLRIEVSKALLTSYVEETKEDRETLADEFSYRLRWFSEFSDQQYVNLLGYYNNKKLNQAYVEDLMLHVLSYLVDSGVSEAHILELHEKGLSKNLRSYEDIKSYNQGLESIFFYEPNFIDGLSLERVRYIFFKGSTLTELREIGLKYGVDVPKRLKKAELLESVYDELKSRNEYNKQIADELSKKTVIAIQRFAQDNKIKVSSELKKEHVIEYILEHANQTRETYFKPETNPYSFVFEDEDNVSKSVQTKKKDTLVVVETPVEVKEETPVETIVVINEVKPEPEVVIEEVKPEPEVVIEEVKPEPEVVIEEVKPEPEVIVEEVKPEPEVIVEEVKPEPEVIVEEIVNPNETKDEVLDEKHTEDDEVIYTKGLETTTSMQKTFINALQYQGTAKDFKQEYSSIDSHKEETVILTKAKAPFELRFLFGIVKFIALIILQTLALILSIVFVLTVMVIVYGSVMHFAEPEALIPINEWINSFEFLGKGLLDHISGVFERIGL
jgi:hypothetical protein